MVWVAGISGIRSLGTLQNRRPVFRAHFLSSILLIALVLQSANVFAQLHAAVLPNHDRDRRGVTLWYFATLINDSDSMARNCRIEIDTELPTILSFWTTDQTNNARTGAQDETADIWPRKAQSFIFRVIATGPTDSDELIVYPTFVCDDMPPAIKISDTNSIDLRRMRFDIWSGHTAQEIEQIIRQSPRPEIKSIH